MRSVRVQVPEPVQAGLRCSAVVFDLDGVLVNSAFAAEAFWRQWVDQREVKIKDLEKYIHGRRSEDIIRDVAPHLDLDQEMLALRCTSIGEQPVRPVEGAAELVATLPDRLWAIVTSGQRRFAEYRLQAAGITRPCVLIAAEDVHKGKPDPEGYLLAARQLGVQPRQIVVLEDSPVGVFAAHAAGAKVLAVATTHDLTELSEADACVKDLAQVTLHHWCGNLELRLNGV